MWKRLIPASILVAYGALLVSLLVLKNVSFRIGHLMFNFSGYATGPANFVPFKTILPYLLGEKGQVIGAFNLVGNVVLFVPVGLLMPLVYPNMTWRAALVLAVTAPLIIEVTQVVFRIGIFDIDDVILNGFGVMIGYWAFLFLRRWARSRQKAAELK